MVIVRFRTKSEHEDILKKVKKMKKFAEELEYCLEDSMDDDEDFDYREDEEVSMRGGRYGYRRGGSRGGRM